MTKNDVYKRKTRQQEKENLEEQCHIWLLKKKEFIAEKEKHGYGNLLEDEFLQLPLDPEKGQAEAAKLLELQESGSRLEEERKILWAEELVVKELNKKHAVVHVDQFYILTEKKNPISGSMDFSLENKQSFRNQYENKRVQCPDGREISKADIWLKSQHRREYAGIIFSPHAGDNITGYYNLWKSFSRNPKQGDCSKYWEHVRDNICSGDVNAYEYVRKWLAFVFQRPEEVHTSLVLCGSQGVGKNSFVEPLGVLLGSHYVLLSSIQELLSNFNFHLKNAILIHANEALWGGNKKELGALKAMITEKNCLIEAKGKDRIMIRNFKHMILSSNEEWPLHIDHDDRRFYVLTVAETHKEDHLYFHDIQQQLDEEGYEALLYDLLSENISSFNPRALPKNEGAFLIKLQSADAVQKYIYDVLKCGCFDVGNMTPQGVWQDVSIENAFNDFCCWCELNGERSVTKELFGRKVQKILPSIKVSRPRGDGVRRRTYELPSLDSARLEFQKYYKAGECIWE